MLLSETGGSLRQALSGTFDPLLKTGFRAVNVSTIDFKFIRFFYFFNSISMNKNLI
jgi:hypothetical protein